MPDDNKKSIINAEGQGKVDPAEVQAKQAKKDAERAEAEEVAEAAEIAGSQQEAIKKAGQEVAGNLGEVADNLRKDPNLIAPEIESDISKKPEQVQTSALGEQTPKQPGSQMPDQTLPQTAPQQTQSSQEQSTQPVKEAEAVNKPEKPQNSSFFDGILKLFGMGKKKTDDSESKEDPHPNSVITVNNSNNPEDIERITVEDKPVGDKPVQTTEVGEDPENKQ